MRKEQKSSATVDFKPNISSSSSGGDLALSSDATAQEWAGRWCSRVKKMQGGDGVWVLRAIGGCLERGDWSLAMATGDWRLAPASGSFSSAACRAGWKRHYQQLRQSSLIYGLLVLQQGNYKCGGGQERRATQPPSPDPSQKALLLSATPTSRTKRHSLLPKALRPSSSQHILVIEPETYSYCCSSAVSPRHRAVCCLLVAAAVALSCFFHWFWYLIFSG